VKYCTPLLSYECSIRQILCGSVLIVLNESVELVDIVPAIVVVVVVVVVVVTLRVVCFVFLYCNLFSVLVVCF